MQGIDRGELRKKIMLQAAELASLSGMVLDSLNGGKNHANIIYLMHTMLEEQKDDLIKYISPLE